jgi:hypothetical protein
MQCRSGARRAKARPGARRAKARPGGGDRDRTDDLMLAKHVLSQLSYAPSPEDGTGEKNPTAFHSWWARQDLNLRPHAYQARALTS